MRSSGDAIVALAKGDDLDHDLPKQLISSGALGAFVWLVIHNEPNPAFSVHVNEALQVHARPLLLHAELHGHIVYC